MWEAARQRTGIAVFAGVFLAAQPSLAQQPATPRPAPVRDDQHAQALKHFERGRELYREGNYKESIKELEAAQTLDPEAKDLVYNLAIVNEKLNRIDEALKWMRRYAEMDLDAQERARSDSTIHRLEGAKKTIDETKKNEPSQAARPTRPDAPTSPPMGRLDTWTYATGAVAIVGLGVGAFFGIDALRSRPTADDHFVTGRDGTYADLEDKASSAHTKAVIADVGFGVFVAGAAACSLLYFMRTRDPDAKTRPQSAGSLGIAPLAGGAAIRFARTFE